MPAAASAQDIGRPVPAKLEIEVVRKFMKYDTKYTKDRKKKYPDLVKPPPEIGAAGTGGVEWVGLNEDPCKAKWLAKVGIVRGNDPDAPKPQDLSGSRTSRRKARPKDGEIAEDLEKKGFSLSAYLSSDDLPYPYWKGDLHGPFTPPKTAGALSHARSLPAIPREDTKSHRTSMHSSVATKASVAKLVSKELGRQLEKMSCHEHYLEQTLNVQGVPSCVKPAPTPADLNELIYYGTSAHGQGRHAYLNKRHRIMPQERSDAPTTAAAEIGWKAYGGKGKWVGKMLEKMKPPPDTICIG